MLIFGFRMRGMGSLEKIRGDMGADATENRRNRRDPISR